MKIETKYNIGNILYYITTYDKIAEFEVVYIEVKFYKGCDEPDIFYQSPRNESFKESGIYNTKDEAKQILIDRIKAM